MSFVIATTESVTAVAENLAGLGSQLSNATVSAAGPTTNVAAAAADEVSAAISQLFGSYGREFQTLSAQAAIFHADFVSLLRGGAAAYVSAEIANSQNLLTGLTASAAAPAAPLDLLGGLGSIFNMGGGSGPLSFLQGGYNSLLSVGPLGTISSGLSKEFGTVALGLLSGNLGSLPQSMSLAGQTAANAGNAYQDLFTNTNTNLSTIGNHWAEHPFPVLQQISANQARYANMISTNFALTFQDFPNGLNHNIEVGYRGATTFDYKGTFEALQARQAANSQTTSTSLGKAFQSLQERLPFFVNDLGGVGQSLGTGDYHGAVYGIPRAVVDLLVGGVNFDNLSTLNTEGPAGDLLPLASGSGALQQELVSLMPPGTIQQQIAQNFVNATNSSLTSVLLPFVGPPIATLDGLAQAATVFSNAIQTGNGVAALGALVDTPAYVLDGFLNGNTVVDITIPLTATFHFPGILGLNLLPNDIGIGAPIVLHMPFTGILTDTQPISASINVPGPTGPVPITMSFGDFTIGGIVPTLLNQLPQSIAAAITPK